MSRNEQMKEEHGSPPRSLDGEPNDANSSTASPELDPSQIDKIIAKEIEGLSLKERNALYEEIHGVSTMAIKESPELIEESLDNFQKELDIMDSKSRRSYDIIANQEGNAFSRSMIQSKEFRLRFLRTEFFDAPKAVKRMLGYFNAMSTIWGEDELKGFDGTMDFFLGKDSEQVGFRMGFLQLLPFRDRSGRKILVHNTDSLQLENTIRFKIWMYILFVAGEDIETQRNGMIMIFWPGVLSLKPPNASFRRFVGEAMQCLPIGKSATRVKVHSGAQTELQYSLMGFGIPVSMIPTTGTGTLKTKAFMQWVKARKVIEAIRKGERGQEDSSLIIECPGVRDVIFRSVGKSCMLNPGNVALRGIFEEYHTEHIQAGQTEKKKLVWKILEEVEALGGRFLVWEKKGWWVPLEDRNEIRNKVATSLRGYNKQRKTDERRQGDSEKRMKFSEVIISDESSEDEPGCLGWTS